MRSFGLRAERGIAVNGSNQPLKLVEQEPGETVAADALWEAYDVPQLLAALREHAGLSVQDVAAALRIRAVYVKAIEDGRFDDLPGPTYSVGFVRAYADYMGLDPDNAVRRFKAERDGLTGRQKLTFPVPVPEARVPGRNLIGLSVVLAVVVYGGWYYISSQDRGAIELVEQVPASLEAALSENDPTGAGQAIEKPAPPVAREAANPVVAAMLGKEATSPGGSDLAGRIEAGDAAILMLSDPTTPPIFGMDAPVAADANSAAPLEQAPDTARLSPNQAAAATPAPPAPPTGEEMAGAPPAPQIAAASPGLEAKSYGAIDGEGRIVLQAMGDSWIQILGRTNQPLFTQFLRAGDRYFVPAQAGLTLTTGSAGALLVTLDGQRLKSLGPVGTVRRGVSLEIANLLQEPGLAAAGD